MISGVTILLDFDTSIDSLSTRKKRIIMMIMKIMTMIMMICHYVKHMTNQSFNFILKYEVIIHTCFCYIFARHECLISVSKNKQYTVET
jgi:hypothetical protein